MNLRRTLFIFFCLCALSLNASSVLATPKKHLIYFGGSNGFHYVPDFLEVIVGDTIEWGGDLTKYWVASVTVPAGAQSFSAD